MQKQIPKLVITGGPCGGKSSAMPFLSKKLSEIGYYPLIVPEAATILKKAGVLPFGSDSALREFEEAVIDLIGKLELSAVEDAILSGHAKPIILCDRGLMDIKACVSDEMFEEILATKSMNVVYARDVSYLGVFHMRTTALGCESLYTTVNNDARSETPEEARVIDERTLEAWIGHSSLAVIGNSGKGFEAKLDLLWNHVLRVLGEPEPHEIERRFLVESTEEVVLPTHSVQVEISQSYIPPVEFGGIRRIRRRAQNNIATYYETVKSHVRAGVAREIEQQIPMEVYDELMLVRMLQMEAIQKNRHHFIYQDQYFELDQYLGSLAGLHILEIELLHEHATVEIPPFLRVVKEITGQSEYSNYALAKNGLPK